MVRTRLLACTGALVASVLVAACASGTPTAGPADTTAPEPGRSSTAAPPSAPAGTSHPLPPKGKVEVQTIPGTVSGFKARPTSIYLPPIYGEVGGDDLPVILMLAGIPGGSDDWLTAGSMVETADALAAQNGGRAPILVATDFSGDGLNDTQCTDAAKGKAETYLMTDVLGYVRKTYKVAPAPRMGVVGLSSGGFCALMLPLRHPDQFSVFGSYSSVSQPSLDPPGNALVQLFNRNQAAFDSYDPTKLLKQKKYPGMGGWFEVGAQDQEALVPTRAVVTQAQQAGIATCLLVRPGGHDYGFWTVAFRNSLPWMAHRLGIGPAPAPGAAVCSPA